MLYKQFIELFDILDSASASGAQVVDYLRSIVPDCKVETYPLVGPKGHTDMVRIMIPGKNGDKRRYSKDHRYFRTSWRTWCKTGTAGFCI